MKITIALLLLLLFIPNYLSAQANPPTAGGEQSDVQSATAAARAACIPDIRTPNCRAATAKGSEARLRQNSPDASISVEGDPHFLCLSHHFRYLLSASFLPVLLEAFGWEVGKLRMNQFSHLKALYWRHAAGIRIHESNVSLNRVVGQAENSTIIMRAVLP